jgi:bacterioferritin-associated ferredoxin
MSHAATSADPIACRCLGVTESQVRDAARLYGVESIRDLAHVNGAGDGCTACHGCLRRVLAEAAGQPADCAFGGGCGL